jgi:hypothetical protein
VDTEYNTVTHTSLKGKSNQRFLPGNVSSTIYTITPAGAAAKGSTVDDTAIQSELTAQILAGHLPRPTVDAAGNPNSYYVIFFPPGITVTQGGTSSCVAGGFCAYHGTVAAAGTLGEYYYASMPDMQAGSGCASGCGTAPTVFANYCEVTSHEMVEMMTDAEVGIATVIGPPIAWYDATNGEIGDICNGVEGTYLACDGQTYYIQLEWSNAQNKCTGYGTPTCGAAPTSSPATATAPSATPVFAPTKAPAFAPTTTPVFAPTKAPVFAPTTTPVFAPTTLAPFVAPVAAPVQAPVNKDTNGNTQANGQGIMALMDNTAAFAGTIVGVVVLIVLIALGVYWYCSRDGPVMAHKATAADGGEMALPNGRAKSSFFDSNPILNEDYGNGRKSDVAAGDGGRKTYTSALRKSVCYIVYLFMYIFC